MPIYGYTCTNEQCGNNQEDECSMSSYETHTMVCTECGGVCKYKWVPSVPQIAFKDGSNSMFPSKGERVRKQMLKRSEIAAAKQNERYGHIKKGIVPNFGGKDTGDWREAQFQALKEKGPESAATYNKMVEKESNSKLIK